jgi:hypothetical protein
MPLLGQDQKLPVDSVEIPLKIKAGIEISGPVLYFIDKSILNLEGFVTTDLNEKLSLYLGGGYSDYSFSQYNYSFKTKGTFYKAGIDFNLLRPEVAEGKYWAGLGLYYGLDRFTSETPTFKHENYWGIATSSIARSTNWGHYLELSGGFKAELFRNFSIGWIISLRKLIYTGAPKDLRPVYYPGYGEGGKTLSFGLNYYISWNIPFKKIKVSIKPEPAEEPEEDAETQATETPPNAGRQGIGY